MAPLTILSVLAAALSCAATSLTAPALALRPSARNPAAASSCQVVLRRLRGGAEGEDEDEDELMELDAELDGGEDDDEADAEAESNLAHANPFLPGGAAAGLGLGDLTKSLSDPAMLQQALKELQDPATQVATPPHTSAHLRKHARADPGASSDWRLARVQNDPTSTLPRPYLGSTLTWPYFYSRVLTAFMYAHPHIHTSTPTLPQERFRQIMEGHAFLESMPHRPPTPPPAPPNHTTPSHTTPSYPTLPHQPPTPTSHLTPPTPPSHTTLPTQYR